MTLPVKRMTEGTGQEDDRGDRARPKRQTSARVRVLVVEDCRALADLVAEGLSDQGIAADVAYDRPARRGATPAVGPGARRIRGANGRLARLPER